MRVLQNSLDFISILWDFFCSEWDRSENNTNSVVKLLETHFLLMTYFLKKMNLLA